MTWTKKSRDERGDLIFKANQLLNEAQMLSYGASNVSNEELEKTINKAKEAVRSLESALNLKR